MKIQNLNQEEVKNWGCEGKEESKEKNLECRGFNWGTRQYSPEHIEMLNILGCKFEASRQIIDLKYCNKLHLYAGHQFSYIPSLKILQTSAWSPASYFLTTKRSSILTEKLLSRKAGGVQLSCHSGFTS